MNDLDLDLDFSTLNPVLLTNPVCTIMLQQFDSHSLKSSQSCSMAGDRTLFDMSDLDIGLDIELSIFNDQPGPCNNS